MPTCQFRADFHKQSPVVLYTWHLKTWVNVSCLKSILHLLHLATIVPYEVPCVLNIFSSILLTCCDFARWCQAAPAPAATPPPALLAASPELKNPGKIKGMSGIYDPNRRWTHAQPCRHHLLPQKLFLDAVTSGNGCFV